MRNISYNMFDNTLTVLLDKLRRYQRENQKPLIEEERTIKWTKKRTNNDRQKTTQVTN